MGIRVRLARAACTHVLARALDAAREQQLAGAHTHDELRGPRVHVVHELHALLRLLRDVELPSHHGSRSMVTREARHAPEVPSDTDHGFEGTRRYLVLGEEQPTFLVLDV